MTWIEYERLPPRVRGVGPDHTVGSIWRATADLGLIDWWGGDRFGLCGYEPRVTLPDPPAIPVRQAAGTRLRLVETYDADEVCQGVGVHDVVEWYEFCDVGDHVTLEVVAAESNGLLVQAVLDPVRREEATTASATLEPDSERRA